MRDHRRQLQKLKDQTGATAVVIAISLVLLVSCAALAIDLANLYVKRNELQNAADAGALAGARNLYLDGGSGGNPGADDIARGIVFLASDDSGFMTGAGLVLDGGLTAQ